MPQKNHTEAGVTGLTHAFVKKTIQRDWSFLVDFLDTEYAELIPSYQITSIGLPFLTVSKETLYKGSMPATFPIVEGEPVEFTFGVNEDAFGSARTLSQHLASRIRKPNGIFYPPNQAKFTGLSLKILGYNAHVHDTYYLTDVLYQSVEALQFDHEGTGLTRLQFTCVADEIKRLA